MARSVRDAGMTVFACNSQALVQVVTAASLVLPGCHILRGQRRAAPTARWQGA